MVDIATHGIKLFVFGPRGFADYRFIANQLDAYVEYFLDIPPDEITLISGGAIGVDSLAIKWAKARGAQIIINKPDYKNHPPKVAPLIRNQENAELCNDAVAFWSGVPGGTYHTMTCLAKLQRAFTVIGLPVENKAGGSNG
ncbi:MAG: DUF2493 domain-containing protein [Candidatus Latescibacteria bacterium]|nr:DUF2493 domain-containing protein [Candidatus Latescibacterota bacterium]NIO78087.1 DUF2493 domain-containing protein [Candidatus Latescibacterota bacterium]